MGKFQPNSNLQPVYEISRRFQLSTQLVIARKRTAGSNSALAQSFVTCVCTHRQDQLQLCEMSAKEKAPIVNHSNEPHYGSVGGGGSVDQEAPIVNHSSEPHYGSVVRGGSVNEEGEQSLTFHDVGYHVPVQCNRRSKTILTSCRRVF